MIKLLHSSTAFGVHWLISRKSSASVITRSLAGTWRTTLCPGGFDGRAKSPVDIGVWSKFWHTRLRLKQHILQPTHVHSNSRLSNVRLVLGLARPSLIQPSTRPAGGGPSSGSGTQPSEGSYKDGPFFPFPRNSSIIASLDFHPNGVRPDLEILQLHLSVGSWGAFFITRRGCDLYDNNTAPMLSVIPTGAIPSRKASRQASEKLLLAK